MAMAITLFHITHGTRRGRGMAVLNNFFGLDRKKMCIIIKISIQL